MIALSLLLAVLVAAPLMTALTAAAVESGSPCESCRRRPAVRIVVADGATFAVCQDCATAGAR